MSIGAFDEHELLGVSRLESCDRFGLLRSLAVAPARRDRGVARQLCDRVLALAGRALGPGRARAIASRFDLVQQIDELTEATWRRVKNWGGTWRQIAAVPVATTVIDRNAFATLFPEVAIPHQGHVHGFPFVNHGGLPYNVFGISATGWSGSLPVERDHSPDYAWHLTRNAEFSYRERPWELERNSVTGGHTHVGSLLEISLCTTVFLGRLAKQARLERELDYELRLDLEGMQGRGISTATGERFDRVPTTSADSRVHAMVRLPLGKIIDEPLDAAFALVGELMLLLRPDLATTEALEKQFQARLQSDAKSPHRCLAFADDLVRQR